MDIACYAYFNYFGAFTVILTGVTFLWLPLMVTVWCLRALIGAEYYWSQWLLSQISLHLLVDLSLFFSHSSKWGLKVSVMIPVTFLILTGMQLKSLELSCWTIVNLPLTTLDRSLPFALLVFLELLSICLLSSLYLGSVYFLSVSPIVDSHKL